MPGRESHYNASQNRGFNAEHLRVASSIKTLEKIQTTPLTNCRVMIRAIPVGISNQKMLIDVRRHLESRHLARRNVGRRSLFVFECMIRRPQVVTVRWNPENDIQRLKSCIRLHGMSLGYYPPEERSNPVPATCCTPPEASHSSPLVDVVTKTFAPSFVSPAVDASYSDENCSPNAIDMDWERMSPPPPPPLLPFPLGGGTACWD